MKYTSYLFKYPEYEPVQDIEICIKAKQEPKYKDVIHALKRCIEILKDDQQNISFHLDMEVK